MFDIGANATPGGSIDDPVPLFTISEPGERITPDVYEAIRAGACTVLAPFTTSDGGIEAPFEVHVVAARRP